MKALESKSGRFAAVHRFEGFRVKGPVGLLLSIVWKALESKSVGLLLSIALKALESKSPVGLLLSIALKALESKSSRLAAVHCFEGFRVKVR